ncbi:MAG: anti-sigma factor antagonist [Desulfuromonas sp.]|mgnify:CR=1 FL=1|nr:MAG: anti-sigma factor antagonist [Desulfuromonas sp.]
MEQTTNKGELVWSGELTVQRVSALKEELQQALSQLDRIEVDLATATQVDISVLQLLCSGHRSAVSLHKVLKLAGTETALLKSVLLDAGFSRHTGCQLDCDESCLWVTDTENRPCSLG